MSKAQETLIARRYAKAFYELAEEQKKLNAISNDIETLKTLPEGGEFGYFLSNPLFKREEQLGVMTKLAKTAKLDKLTANFLGTIVENGRLSLLKDIVDAVASEISSRKGEVKAVVTSARKLTPAQAKKIADNLKKATGSDIDVELKEDEKIMGGLIIKVGSLLIDQSVKTRLERLERALKSDSIASKKNELRDAA